MKLSGVTAHHLTRGAYAPHSPFIALLIPPYHPPQHLVRHIHRIRPHTAVRAQKLTDAVVSAAEIGVERVVRRRRQAEARAAGIAAPDTGEVVPFEAVPVQPVDARLAWEEAGSAFGFFGTNKAPALKAPAEPAKAPAGPASTP